MTERDLSWFWHPCFYTTWTLDQASASVASRGDSTTITVRNRGRASTPTPIAITRRDGTMTHKTVSVEVWLKGAQCRTVTVPRQPQIVRVEIDPHAPFPDLRRSNQVWER